MILMMAIEQDWDDWIWQLLISKIDDESSLFFCSCGSCSSRNDFGGGCEMTMHADKVVAAETYIGFSRNGSWCNSGGGGTKRICFKNF